MKLDLNNSIDSCIEYKLIHESFKEFKLEYYNKFKSFLTYGKKSKIKLRVNKLMNSQIYIIYNEVLLDLGIKRESLDNEVIPCIYKSRDCQKIFITLDDRYELNSNLFKEIVKGEFKKYLEL